MYLANVLALPPAVILLLCTAAPAAAAAAAELQWPHNLPRHMKYFPEDEAHAKRGISIQDRLRREKPIGVKKMSSDEGEMFFLDNWIFASDVHEKRDEDAGELHNITDQVVSPLRPHSEQAMLDSMLRFAVRDTLMKRQFKCPEGTNDCSSIGAPNSCCGTGSTCITVEDTGYGSVGCCPNGRDCSGDISCNEDAGYTSCPNSPNGGCCLPGYSCHDVGCIAAGTSITYVQPPTSTPRPSSATSAAVTVVPTTPSATTPSTSATPTSSSAYTCSTGWFSCPASLGGGCCQNGRECATGASCIGSDEPTSTSSMAPDAPVRPTSGITSEEPAPTLGGDGCPVGFYVCSAYYPSGCCRVGRDCQTTGSCVPTSSETILNTNGVVVVAPTGASVATTAAPQGGSCPSAWYSCPANRGGNCCPDGFECGEQCTATAGTSVSNKVAPSTASFFPPSTLWVLASGAVGIGAAMLLL
ncbi:hypothetical protein BS50DRAFT_632477 [Corynespora cassiicola Philippines]|uniref:GPI anchored protein n=1 Tax=Corynespora cassiicola Philippines TaxID=1448308 RepID=A0A2T2NSZ8_CORCC|nr:hypothetical protein BS50DRAFT_632477 [Corynespora cassiicola Philippines]